MKVLLVEDDPLHAAFLRDAVGQALPEVSQILTADNGREGEVMARRGVGAVVMDLQMKERNGIDAARTIWSERPETRILFWSNYADEAYLRGLSRIVPHGSPYGYVLKTAPVQRLHLAMRAVLVEGQVLVDREIHRLQQRQSRPAHALSESEYTVLLDMALGLPDREIARRRGMSERTVQNRLLSLYDKLAVDLPGEGAPAINKRVRAVACALSSGALNAEALRIAEREMRDWLLARPAESQAGSIRSR
ncbi:response regulator transcription factor [Paracoccus sp. CPCC 101403]|uniref:Response regulator transcription factor n=1 Tax=Paracoccus broussonetiae TaxID=3075834 RepID=A0ABU3EB01_9RHOB|nr:response regulator transcription factor [Paracoccus sp. CPCC 101403]MDT1061397.1 response regulator transcription factor [Paracoccus sp. CPCC 101403]